jgi:hypothetical protein
MSSHSSNSIQNSNADVASRSKDSKSEPHQFKAHCLRRVANWSKIEAEHKIDKPTFSADKVLKDLQDRSPKMKALLDTIARLDAQDMKQHGHHFKHFIFSDVKSGGYGAKIIASCLAASGKHLIYNKNHTLKSDNQLRLSKDDNFALLSSTAVFDKPIAVKTKKSIFSLYNRRPDNVWGSLLRFVVMDSGFKEGVDLFDVKYVHIFEPQVSKADQRQVIGRATRTCGQMGLDFHPKQGWPLEVFQYDVEIPEEHMRGSDTTSDTLFDLFLENSDIDKRLLVLADELDKYTIIGSVDYELNKNIHRFKIEDEDEIVEQLDFSGGGASPAPINCASDNCGKSRPTKDVPVSNVVLVLAAVGRGLKIPDLQVYPRDFFCKALRKDAKYCDHVRKAAKDPMAYVHTHKDVFEKYLKSKKYTVLPSSLRKEVVSFIDTAKFKRAMGDSTLPPFPESKVGSFVEMRNYINTHYSRFTWPKVKLENHCGQIEGTRGGGGKIIEFTPTQDFVRHYFTPSHPLKGILLNQSVGTGKCHAKNTPILMFDGSIKMVQDVVIGDVIMGDNSKPRTVLDLGRGVDEMYKVIPTKGDPYVVNSEHILCLKYSGKESELLYPFKKEDDVLEIEVNDYLKLPEDVRKELKGYYNPVSFPSKPVEFDPYLVGFWLGDETSMKTDMSTEDEDVIRYLQSTHGIPLDYKANDRDTQIQVLAGLIDCNGIVSDDGYDIVQKQKEVAEDIVYLCRSLGFSAYSKECVETGTYYRITISGDDLHQVPVKVARKKLEPRQQVKDVLLTQIKVEHVGRDNYYGFTLDGNHRYLLGDFTVTHNTCAAIATATTTFEKAGYTILWVTRTTLKNDIWKNMFDQVCSMTIKEQIESGVQIPEEQEKRMKMLSDAWAIRPISYKQFTNLIEGKNQLYERLVKRNGKTDPLRKTLLIIDEAHKLYGGSDLSTIEKPNMEKLQAALMKSYKVSGNHSVKLMLMTATPYTNDPMELIKLVNLCKESELHMPDTYEAFAARYLNVKEGVFSKKGRMRFLNDIAGYISYLNRERDARQFAQPRLHPIVVPRVVDNHYTIAEQIKQLEKQSSEIGSKLFKMRLSYNLAKEKLKDKKQEVGDMRAMKEGASPVTKRQIDINIHEERMQIDKELRDFKKKYQSNTKGLKAEYEQVINQLKKLTSGLPYEAINKCFNDDDEEEEGEQSPARQVYTKEELQRMVIAKKVLAEISKLKVKLEKQREKMYKTSNEEYKLRLKHSVEQLQAVIEDLKVINDSPRQFKAYKQTQKEAKKEETEFRKELAEERQQKALEKKEERLEDLKDRKEVAVMKKEIKLAKIAEKERKAAERAAAKEAKAAKAAEKERKAAERDAAKKAKEEEKKRKEEEKARKAAERAAAKEAKKKR